MTRDAGISDFGYEVHDGVKSLAFAAYVPYSCSWGIPVSSVVLWICEHANDKMHLAACRCVVPGSSRVAGGGSEI